MVNNKVQETQGSRKIKRRGRTIQQQQQQEPTFRIVELDTSMLRDFGIVVVTYMHVKSGNMFVIKWTANEILDAARTANRLTKDEFMQATPLQKKRWLEQGEPITTI